MRIGELSKRTGVSTSRIRFYERRAVLPKAIRAQNGYREYPDAVVKMLSLIDASQRLGFSLGEIRDALSEAAPEFPSRATMVAALKSKLSNIDRHLRELQTRRSQIEQLLKDMGDQATQKSQMGASR